MRIVHTSDVQLGAPFRFLGEKGAVHRQQLRRTFSRIVDLAASLPADILLISGDLFDDSRPPDLEVDLVAAELARLRLPVCILPGNHDCLTSNSIWQTFSFPNNVHTLTARPSVLEFADLDLTVYGNPIASPSSRQSPLRGLSPTGSTRWHVALAHGNLVRGDIANPARPIEPDEIVSSQMDYVALGDWHAFADYSQGRVKAYYAGSPEPIAHSQEGSGLVAVIDLGDGGVRVRPERVGRVTAEAWEVDVSGWESADVLAELRERADPSLMAQITLVGQVELGMTLDAATVEDELAPDFYHVTCLDRSHPQSEVACPDKVSETLVAGRFVRLMRERIEQAEGEAERRRAEQALQLGVALLQGRRVF